MSPVTICDRVRSVSSWEVGHGAPSAFHPRPNPPPSRTREPSRAIIETSPRWSIGRFKNFWSNCEALQKPVKGGGQGGGSNRLGQVAIHTGDQTALRIAFH